MESGQINRVVAYVQTLELEFVLVGALTCRRSFQRQLIMLMQQQHMHTHIFTEKQCFPVTFVGVVVISAAVVVATPQIRCASKLPALAKAKHENSHERRAI